MTSPKEVMLEILGRQLRVNTAVEPERIGMAVDILEDTFRNMERAYELQWGVLPSALDTSSWLIMGALNIAHYAVSLEGEARQHTQNLERTIDNLLADVPDDVGHIPSHIFSNSECGT